MERRRYSGYRGRASVRDVLRVVLALLVIVLVLAATGLLAVQRYIVYTDDGIRLELPFFQRETPPAVDASVELDIVQRSPVTEPDQFDWSPNEENME